MTLFPKVLWEEQRVGVGKPGLWQRMGVGSRVSKEVDDESCGGVEGYQVSYTDWWARVEAPVCSRLLLSAHRESKNMRTQGDGTWLDSENSKNSIYHLSLIDLKTKEDPQSERHHDCPSNCSCTRSQEARQRPVNNTIMFFYSSGKTMAVRNASPCSLFLGTFDISVHLWASSSDLGCQGWAGAPKRWLCMP